MRWRPLTWFLLSGLLFAAGMYCWRLANEWEARKSAASRASAPAQPAPASQPATRPAQAAPSPAPKLLSLPALPKNEPPGPRNPSERLAHRLSNTSQTIGQLTHNSHAILLENALIDTGDPAALRIPDKLRAQGDPGSYIVQSRTALNDAFRAKLSQAGATIVSYIPNNAYLVRASESAAQQMTSWPETQSVLAYEPYFKLKSSLLNLAVSDNPLPDESRLSLLVFSDALTGTLDQLNQMGVEVLAQERSPFGPVLRVKPPVNTLAALASLSGVQEIEYWRPRVVANDLSRQFNGVAFDSVNPLNYLGLTGTNIIVNVNDTGVDTNHPDLMGRVFYDYQANGVDTDGHGTHVAGIIASSGAQSLTVTNASGSVMPPVAGQFRGMAPAATIFAMGANVTRGPFQSDQYLQETAAQTNSLISNNSWNYSGDNEYDLAAASYDAAVRDALPQVPYSQPVLYVFAAGNSGLGQDDGSGGAPDSIQSPATAKNVITVGASELPRNITNNVWKCTPTGGTNGTEFCLTNQPWAFETDSSDQVASFSSRGNVGVLVEGPTGRFKPDVVAPGTFVVSTRSTVWDQVAYYNPTSHQYFSLHGLVLNTNESFPNSIFIPANAVQVTIQVSPNIDSPTPFPDMPIYVRQAFIASPTNYDFVKTNTISMPPDGGPNLGPVDVNWFYTVVNQSKKQVSFDVSTDITVTNDQGNYFEVLSNLNNQLGPYYRYETGTSMAAADVSGVLALMEEFFINRVGRTNSPALMKALLINGARSLGQQYDLQVQSALNFQGWGMVNLASSLHGSLTNGGSTKSMFYWDQGATNALVTGESHTRFIKVTPAGQQDALRVTLAWTDPPGNPVASVKLVNDLDLVVTNLDTGDVFFGNDIGSSADFNTPWDTNSTPNIDTVNNVENVYLIPGLGTNYSITVIGSHVNVNAVTTHPNNVAQDYALVISCGDGEVVQAMALTDGPDVTVTTPYVTVVTNSFVNTPDIAGGLLLNQRVGANSPLLGTNTIPWAGSTNGLITLGMTNQWHFYLVTNNTSFTNAAFLTFVPPNIALPRMGVFESKISNASRTEADIDLYVSRDPNLTNLVPSAVQAADKSLERGGTETIVYSNATPGIYYVGVKSEDQEAAQYGFISIFSLNPFGNSDAQGNQTLRGFPSPAPIPDGTPQTPGVADIFAIGIPRKLHRVVVTNVITHQLMGDLQGTLVNNRDYAVLNNHAPDNGVTNQIYIYDDTDQHDIAGSRPTDGPGSLKDFTGKQNSPQWHVTEVDSAANHTGTNVALVLWLEKQQDLTNGIIATLPPGGCRDDTIDVPIDATNLTVAVSVQSGVGPVTLQVCPVGASGSDCQSTIIGGPGATNLVTIDKSSNPPLNSGTYNVRTCNLGTAPVTIYILATISVDIAGVATYYYRSGGPVPILDDAVSDSSITVNDDRKIASVEVGVRIDHPRVSDLVLTLISPTGQRYLLCENRGGGSTNGMGIDLSSTNIIPVSSNGGPDPQTNNIDTGQTSGSITINYNMYQIPDSMHVYYQGVRIFDSGLISGTGTTNITFGPGNSTIVTIIMNENGNQNPTTKWDYTVTSYSASYLYLTFSEDTNKSSTPIKFAPPPFVPNFSTSTTPLSDFEPASPGDYFSGDLVDGWSVSANQVSVIRDPALSQAGSNLLALAAGSITRPLTTIPGHLYTVSYSYRGPSIVGMWRGEDNGVDSVAGRNGTVENLAFAPGEVGEAFWLDPSAGNGQRVSVPDNPAFALTNSLSIEGWVQPTGDGYTIFWRGDDRPGLDPYVLSMQLDTTVGFYIDSGAGPPTSPVNISATLSYNQWWHLAATLDGNTGDMKLYTNGVVAAAINTSLRPFGPLLANHDPAIGICNVGEHINDFPFNGEVDEISLYNRALTASEVKAIYSAGSAGKFDPGLAIPTALSEARISVAGITNVINGNNTNWSSGTISFTADAGASTFVIDGLQPGMLLDTFALSGVTGTNGVTYLPEESLSGLLGQSAKGTWQLEVWDNRAGATNPAPTLLGWQLAIQYQTPIPQPIVAHDDVPLTNTVNPGQIQYYSIDVPDWASFATNWLIYATGGSVNMLFNQTGLPTGTNATDYTLLANSLGGIFPLSSNTVPPLVNSATYYIGIQNTGTVAVTFAFQVNFDVTPLTNAIPVTSTMAFGPPQRYFSYDVSSNATSVEFLLTNLDGNVNLVAMQAPNFPTLATNSYASLNPGSNNEAIIIFTNSEPVVLSPGRWYLGVFNADVGPVDYTIVALEFTNPVPPIITLYNKIPYANTNNGTGAATDYYVYTVSTNAVRAQFEIIGPSTNMTLVARWGLPLPSLASYDYISANPGLDDELITVFNYSKPVALTPGEWFLSAVNLSPGPATYTIMASEFPVYATNLVITGWSVSPTGFCITWDSVPGIDYYVQALTNLSSTTWVTVSHTIRATANSTTFCLPIPSVFHFMRVAEGLALNPYLQQIKITSITRVPGGVVLRWTAPANYTFQVQWTPSLFPANWKSFTNIVTSASGNFLYVDDGSQSGGLAGPRYYRLLQLSP
jgi:subtilisin-like proprotein convertase family protein